MRYNQAFGCLLPGRVTLTFPPCAPQAIRHYTSATQRLPDAPQAYHGLAQLYRHTGDASALADVLNSLLSNAPPAPAAAEPLARERAEALLQAARLPEASAAVAALVSQQRGELPPELVILQADVQLAVEEEEYERRVAEKLQQQAGDHGEGDSGGGAAAAAAADSRRNASVRQAVRTQLVRAPLCSRAQRACGSLPRSRAEERRAKVQTAAESQPAAR